MKLSSVLLPLAAISIVSTAAQAADQPAHSTSASAGHDASIAFANHGGVWDWRSEGDRVVYFEDSRHQWYRAELSFPAVDLPFAQHIGVDAGPTDSLDRFGAIYVHGQKYNFNSFVKIDGQPPKKMKGKPKG